MANAERIWALLDELYRITDQLTSECGRPCTPSGLCVGTPGEALVAETFGLELLEGNAKEFDAVTPGGEMVQIRTTQKGHIVPIYGGNGLLLVAKLDLRLRKLDLIYGGPASQPWKLAVDKGPNHRGVHSLAIGSLIELHNGLPPSARLEPCRLPIKQ
jgi:hypothetical protein